MRRHTADPVLSVNVRPVTVRLSPSGEGVGGGGLFISSDSPGVQGVSPCKPPTICSLFREGGE